LKTDSEMASKSSNYKPFRYNCFSRTCKTKTLTLYSNWLYNRHFSWNFCSTY